MTDAYTHLAAVYDDLMAPDADYDAWTDFILAQARQRLGAPPETALDAACGTGAIALRLAAQGLRVTACDASADMLAVAAGKARAQGLPLPTVCQPLQALAVHRPVQVLTCVCDGLNYLTTPADLAAFAKHAAGVLIPGGVLVFDISTPHKLQNLLGDQSFCGQCQTAAYLWDGAFDAAAGLLHIDLTLFARQPGGHYHRAQEAHTQRAWTRAQVDQALGQAFLPVDWYGPDLRSPAGEQDARWHGVAVKRVKSEA